MKTQITKSMMAIWTLVLLSANQNINAQAFEEGKNYISVGYGYELFNAKKLFTGDLYNDFTVSGFGPLAFKYEYGLSDKIGMGVNVGFSKSDVEWNYSTFSGYDSTGNSVYSKYNYNYSFKKITAQARVNYHIGDNDKLDPYVGFGIGYKSAKWTFESNEPGYNSTYEFPSIPLSMSISFGLRYYFTDNIGIFAEAGMGHGVFQGGLQMKF